MTPLDLTADNILSDGVVLCYTRDIMKILDLGWVL
jgi:hypothetical protein